MIKSAVSDSSVVYILRTVKPYFISSWVLIRGLHPNLLIFSYVSAIIPVLLSRSQQAFPVKGQTVNILSVSGRTVSHYASPPLQH